MTILAWVLVVAVVIIGAIEISAFVASKRKKHVNMAKTAEQNTMPAVHVGPAMLTLFAIKRDHLPPKVQAEVAEHVRECRRCALLVREARHSVV